MELRMVELVARPAAVTVPTTVLSSVAIDLNRMSSSPWQPKVYGSTFRTECGDRAHCGVVWGNDNGKRKEKEGLRIGRLVLGRRYQWRRAIITAVENFRIPNSVAEAPSTSEASHAEVVELDHQPQDRQGVLEPRGLQGDGGESLRQPQNGAADEGKRGVGDRGESHNDPKTVLEDVEKRGQQDGADVGESSSGEQEEDLMEKGFKMSQICDRLIEVFSTERTTPAEWRSLLVLSSEWIRIRPHFYKRCKAKARAETVPKRKSELNKLARKVKEVDDNMVRQDKFLAELEKNPFEIDIIVAHRRDEFTGDFFEHLEILSDATSRSSRRDEIAAIAGKCLSLIEAHDFALEDTEAMTEAQLKFEKILNSNSLEAAANQINQLAQSKELDSALLLLITKAWAAAKDSTTMKEEVKEIMLYLYKAAKRSMLKLVPDEIHIIQRLLSIPDPRDRFAAMTESFAPGDDLELKNENNLHTSPEKLKHWMKLLVDAYHTHKQTTMIKEAQKLMNPEAISRLEILLQYMDESFII